MELIKNHKNILLTTLLIVTSPIILSSITIITEFIFNCGKMFGTSLRCFTEAICRII
ncbi:MAG: hypothetical protein IJO32_01405 [Bacilli bacterium]|nr:hypothetical protein [Bacilli bacterium]